MLNFFQGAGASSQRGVWWWFIGVGPVVMITVIYGGWGWSPVRNHIWFDLLGFITFWWRNPKSLTCHFDPGGKIVKFHPPKKQPLGVLLKLRFQGHFQNSRSAISKGKIFQGYSRDPGGNSLKLVRPFLRGSLKRLNEDLVATGKKWARESSKSHRRSDLQKLGTYCWDESHQKMLVNISFRYVYFI